jgi:hypothetical protein
MTDTELPKKKSDLEIFLEKDPASYFTRKYLASEVIGLMNEFNWLADNHDIISPEREENTLIYTSNDLFRSTEVRIPNTPKLLQIDDDYSRQNCLGIRKDSLNPEIREVWPFDGVTEAGEYLSMMQEIVRDSRNDSNLNLITD